MSRILLVGNYPPPFGGISVHVQLLHRFLQREGIVCQVLNVDPRATADSQYINVHGYGDFFCKLARASRNSIVHLHTNGHNTKSWLIAEACAWTGRMLGVGSVLTIHSGMAPNFILDKKNRWLVRTALQPLNRVICVNTQIQQALIKIGFPAEKTALLPAFLFDERELSPLGQLVVTRLSRFRPLLSLVAFFRPEYGVELMIEALSRLTEQFPDIGCAVMGSGDGESALRRLAEQHGVAERLLWFGDLEHGQCLSVIKSSQLFVRPTLADGDSVSVREAVQMSVPVVASNVGYRPSECLLFNAGSVADLTEKCAAMLTDSRTINRDMPSATSFTPLMNIYRQILSPSATSGWEREYEQKRSTIK